ncbi:8290_t:CDS:2, partial [Funneliformis geosporum]
GLEWTFRGGFEIACSNARARNVKHTLKVNNNRTRDLTRFGELESKGISA